MEDEGKDEVEEEEGERKWRGRGEEGGVVERRGGTGNEKEE